MEVNPRHYRRPDNQWKCGLTSGGQGCAVGPDAKGRCENKVCYPRRTLQWWRSYLPIALAMVTLGTIVVMNQTGLDRDAIAPGPLTSVHAQLIHNPSDPHRCASCHDEQRDGSSWMAQTGWSTTSIAAHSQTERCLTCHARDLPRMKLGSPHDLPEEELARLSAGQTKKAMSAESLLVSFQRNRPIDWHEHSLACGDCHREHQGPQHDLEAISSQRCQACHQNQFRSFAVDHPEFREYPKPSSQSVAFNHSRHRDLHFAKSNAAFDCRTCHVDESVNGRVGQVFRSTSFETACASCHQTPISSSLPDGLVVFQLPSLDITGLKNSGVDIGAWPDEASQILDGSIPLLMQWLLRGDIANAKVFEAMPRSGKLSDFDVKTEADRDAIATLAQATKHLLSELAQDGQKVIQTRLAIEGQSSDNQTVMELLRGVPPDLFRQAYREWFETITTKPSSRETYTSSNEPAPFTPATEKTNGADDLLSEPQFATGFSSDRNRPDLSNPRSWKDIRSRQHLPAGGWMIDRKQMAIVYIPSGHADRWLTAFLTLGHSRAIENKESTDRTDKEKSSQIAQRFFDEHLQPTSLGRCAECHQGLTKTLPVRAPAELWHAKRFDARVRELTRFNHGPHLIQSKLQDCKACHRLNDKESINVAIGSDAVDHFKHVDFLPIQRSDCASCHRPNAAGDHCTQCHNYHTNAIE
jgi:hypothetical protein